MSNSTAVSEVISSQQNDERYYRAKNILTRKSIRAIGNPAVRSVRCWRRSYLDRRCGGRCSSSSEPAGVSQTDVGRPLVAGTRRDRSQTCRHARHFFSVGAMLASATPSPACCMLGNYDVATLPRQRQQRELSAAISHSSFQ